MIKKILILITLNLYALAFNNNYSNEIQFKFGENIENNLEIIINFKGTKCGEDFQLNGHIVDCYNSTKDMLFNKEFFHVNLIIVDNKISRYRLLKEVENPLNDSFLIKLYNDNFVLNMNNDKNEKYLTYKSFKENRDNYLLDDRNIDKYMDYVFLNKKYNELTTSLIDKLSENKEIILEFNEMHSKDIKKWNYVIDIFKLNDI